MAGLPQVYRTTVSAAALGLRVVSGIPLVRRRWVAERDRLGILDASTRAVLTGAPTLWVHAASVGELQAVRSLLGALRRRYPGRSLIVSTLTRTGLALARTLPEAHAVLLFPLDAPRVVARVLRGVRMEAFFFTETEIWPTWLGALAAAGTPTFMVSGRVSERTFRRARWLKRLYRQALHDVVCCMQTDDDAGRIIELGAPPGRVHVAGSLKFDAAAVVPPPELEHMRRALDAAHLRAIVAGSTHDGEEAMVLDAYDRVVRGHRETILLLAPRHPERVAGVADLVAARGIPLLRYSELVRDPTRGLPAAPLVLLLDVVGPLAHCYALGEVAFVGGSLVPVGGHNVLEPARAARPIVVGPHTDSIRDLVERLRRVDAAIQVDSAEALAWTVDHLLANPELAQRMGRQGAALAQAGQGALDRHMRIIAARLERTRFVRDGE